jgi:hypothetical protein
MRGEAVAEFDREMRRFAALPREEQLAELAAALSPSLADAVRCAFDGSVYDALKAALA